MLFNPGWTMDSPFNIYFLTSRLNQIELGETFMRGEAEEQQEGKRSYTQHGNLTRKKLIVFISHSNKFAM